MPTPGATPQFNISRLHLAAMASLAWLISCAPGRAIDDAAVARMQHVPPMVKDSIQQDPLDGNATMDLRLALPLHHEDELDALIADLYDPHSPRFGHYITPQAFAARYLPDANDVAAVRAVLGARHLTVKPEAHGTLLTVHGRVADVQAAMGTTLYNYTSADGTQFSAPAQELQLPEGLPIVAVHGLCQGIAPHAQYAGLRTNSPISGLGPMRLAVTQAALNANAIRQAYSVPPSMQGDGQSVGMFQLDHFEPNDIIAYCRINNLPLPNISAILISGAQARVVDANVQVEVTLDIELLHAMAPALSEIRLYQGPAKATFQNYLDVLNEMANPSLGDKKLLRVLTTSYGYYENELSKSALQSEGAIFKQMAAQGQAFFAAAGDTGAYANPGTPGELAVIDPAAQPFVTAVGGTRLSVGALSAYGSETTWSQGGGGSSRMWPLPTYQASLAATHADLASTSARNVPDVALNADPNTGYAIFVQGARAQVGGTSCGAPIWAGFMALIDAERAAQGQRSMGFFNPTLYRLMEAPSGAGLMHDVTSGLNGYYSAGTGYDNATGWGTPNGTMLLSAFFLAAPRRTLTAPSWSLQ